MSLSLRTTQILREALADLAAADDLIANLGQVDSLGLSSLGANGLVARTGLATSAARTITGTASQVTVANGDGAAGNPTLSLPAAVNVTTSYSVGGTKVVGAQGVLVADATNGTDVITQLNLVLARLRAHGLIAT